ncbi:hypothetical protein ACLOJK_020870 [Asimina triloba]
METHVTAIRPSWGCRTTVEDGEEYRVGSRDFQRRKKGLLDLARKVDGEVAGGEEVQPSSPAIAVDGDENDGEAGAVDGLRMAGDRLRRESARRDDEEKKSRSLDVGFGNRKRIDWMLALLAAKVIMKSMKKDASSHLSQILTQTSVRNMANSYAVQLELISRNRHVSDYPARSVHAHMITSGFRPRGHILNQLIDIYCKTQNLVYAHGLFDAIPQPDIVARTTLVAAYSNRGDLKFARKLFDETPVRIRDAVSYNAMISGYSRNGDGSAAVELFRRMGRDHVRPDDFTFTSVLSGLAIVADDEMQCRQLHCAIAKSGVESVVCVSNALLSVYMKCPSTSTDSARLLFNLMPERDELSWTTIITGYVRHGELDAARQLFDGMEVKLDVAWNAMISGYVHHGHTVHALELFRKMLSAGIEPDEFTYTSLLSACANAGLLLHGKEAHAYILRTDPVSEPEVSLPVENALITLYWKCGKVDDARRIFDKMVRRDVVSWNAILSGYVTYGHIAEAQRIFETMPEKNKLSWTVMISGFAQYGLGEEGLKLFNRMREEGLEPCDFAFAGAITACAGLGALEQGRQFHAQLIQVGFNSSISTGNALVTMYARCGVVEAAHDVFLTMPFVDSVSWNAMIAALAQHGQGSEALELFEQMLCEGVSPDRITFLTLLSACSHAGLVEEGCQFFDLMDNVYGLAPGADHYARLIDLLCRAGKLSEAKDMIQKMPFKPGPPIWEALLAGCRIHGDMALGILAAEKLFELAPQHDGTYVLLSNMFAAMGLWDDVARVRKTMKDRGVKKEPGCSWIEVANKVHVFLVDDSVHPEVQLVYSLLEKLGAKMRKLGYIPKTNFVLHDMESEQKEYALSTHSEKLAVGYGLLKLPAGATDMMDVQDNGWSGAVSSVVSNSESGEPSQREHSLLAEDAAWIDSCLTLNPEMSDDAWGPLKEALLDIISTSVSLGHKQAATLVGRAISEAGDDVDMKSEEAEAMPLRGDTGDPILINPFDREEIGDAEAEVAALSAENIESPEDIFKVWDLSTELEEDDFVKQLNKALTESSLRDLPLVRDYSSRIALDAEVVDDLIAGISDLSLRPSTG